MPINVWMQKALEEQSCEWCETGVGYDDPWEMCSCLCDGCPNFLPDCTCDEEEDDETEEVTVGKTKQILTGWWDKFSYGAGGTAPAAKATLPAATSFQKCRHYGITLELPDGTPIQVSSHFTRKTAEEKATAPDFGVYLASSWHSSATCLALSINWPDFSTPAIPMEQVKEAAEVMIEMAKLGKKVETGCIGGHGRTGTFLALLVMMTSDLDPEDAMQWVWDHYCKEAIEGAEQEWYIEAFYATEHGLEVPAKPVSTYSYGGFGAEYNVDCGREVHKAMWLGGKLTCQGQAKSKPGCKWYHQDAVSFNNEPALRGKGPDPVAIKAELDKPKLTSTPPQLPDPERKWEALFTWTQQVEGETWKFTEWDDGVITSVMATNDKKVTVYNSLDEWMMAFPDVQLDEYEDLNEGSNDLSKS